MVWARIEAPHALTEDETQPWNGDAGSKRAAVSQRQRNHHPFAVDDAEAYGAVAFFRSGLRPDRFARFQRHSNTLGKLPSIVG